MRKILARIVAITLIVGLTYTAGIYTEKFLDERAANEWPADSWQDIDPDKYYVISPPGMMWIFEVEKINGEIMWRQLLMPIPPSWNKPSNYISPKDQRERDFREKRRFEWDLGQEQNPTVEAAPVVETSKKKKKKKPIYDSVDREGILQDSNQDGIVAFDWPLVYVEPEEEGDSAMLYTGWTHICCGCSLVHQIGVVVYWSGIQWRIHQRWDVDEKETEWRRTRKFGRDHPWANRPFFPNAEHQTFPLDR